MFIVCHLKQVTLLLHGKIRILYSNKYIIKKNPKKKQ